MAELPRPWTQLSEAERNDLLDAFLAFAEFCPPRHGFVLTTEGVAISPYGPIAVTESGWIRDSIHDRAEEFFHIQRPDVDYRREDVQDFLIQWALRRARDRDRP